MPRPSVTLAGWSRLDVYLERDKWENIMFDYLIDRLENAQFSDEPFRHVYLDNFFSKGDFQAIIKAPEVSIPPSKDTAELIARLTQYNYSPLSFPGCTVDPGEYLKWHENKFHTVRTHSATEGFGMAFRLMRPVTPVLAALDQFFASERFHQALAAKFEVDLSRCRADTGLQKYLDGYEISPHPDVRSKAATYMVNINPHPDSESLEQHTLYLEFIESKRYVQAFWRENPSWERDWVPWEWCKTVETQSANNSAVFFSPSDDTMHAVRLDYDHLDFQRTQFYGNLWYEDVQSKSLKWESLDIAGRRTAESARDQKSMKSRLKRLMRR